jgi:hypothetical protein
MILFVVLIYAEVNKEYGPEFNTSSSHFSKLHRLMNQSLKRKEKQKSHIKVLIQVTIFFLMEGCYLKFTRFNYIFYHLQVDISNFVEILNENHNYSQFIFNY